EPLYRQSVEIFRQTFGDKNLSYAGALAQLADCCQVQGEAAKALPLYRQVLDIARLNMELNAAMQSERQQRAMAAYLRLSLDRYRGTAAIPQVPAKAAYADLLYWKGSILARQRQIRLDASDPKLVPLVQELRTTTDRLAAMTFAIPDPKQREAFNRQLAT